MTISVVQTALGSINNQGATFGAGVTSGNFVLVASGSYNSGGPPSPNSPTLGGSTPAGTSQLIEEPSPGSSNTVGVAYYLMPVTAGVAGATALVSSWSNNEIGIIAWELHSSTGTLTLDKSSTGQGTSSSFSSGTTGAITGSSEIVAGVAAGFGISMTHPGSPYTDSDGSGGSNFIIAGYQIVTSSGGTYSYAAGTSGSANWAAGIVTLTDGSSSGAPADVPYLIAQNTGFF